MHRNTLGVQPGLNDTCLLTRTFSGMPLIDQSTGNSWGTLGHRGTRGHRDKARQVWRRTGLVNAAHGHLLRSLVLSIDDGRALLRLGRELQGVRYSHNSECVNTLGCM